MRLIKLGGLILATAAVLSVGAWATASSGSTHVQRAMSKLFGPGTMKARAAYKEIRNGSVLSQRLVVQISRAAHNKLIPVYINDVKVGRVHTNAAGVGTINLLRTSVNGHAGHGTLPAAATSLGMGDVARIGRISGNFFDPDKGTMQRFEVQGTLTSNSTLNGEVQYEESYHHGVINRDFQIELEGASPNESFDILVNGVVVGTIMADHEGASQLEYSTGEGDDEGEGESLPMPAGFPSIHDGDVVTIGIASATMAMDDDQGEGEGEGGDEGGDHGGHNGGDD